MMIILLDGPSSSGKTSIARAIQEISDMPWLNMGIDALSSILPAQYFAFGSRASGGFFIFTPEYNDHGASITITPGPLGRQLWHSGAKMVRVLADDGYHIVIDEVIDSKEKLSWYIAELSHHVVYVVGVSGDLCVRQTREMARGDRPIGVANGYNTILSQCTTSYDVLLDTTNATAESLAHTILYFIAHNKEPKSFAQLRNVVV